MSRRPAGALAGIAMIFLLAAPAGSPASSPQGGHGAFDVPRPGVPLHDVVVKRQSVSAARISATASSRRYPINDGSGDSISVDVTAACQETCTDADPQQIANFVGTLLHGNEVSLLTVELDTPYQLTIDCGYGAEACYYSGENRIAISGNNYVEADSVSREFVLAHEYGHHVAQHRHVPRPFPAAINWGTERWATQEHVCQGKRSGSFYPGDEGSHYYEDPGEAFAESYAFNRFPDAQVKWAWVGALKPDPGAFKAIQSDVLSPWHPHRKLLVKGRLSAQGRPIVSHKFSTPLDGKVSVRLQGAGSHSYELMLRNRVGKRLRGSHGVDLGREVSYTVCGQAHLQAAVRRLRPHGGPFKLIIREP